MSFAASVASIAPLAASLKGRGARASSASSRRPVRVNAAANSPGFIQKGKYALSGVLSVPKEMEGEVDAMWKSHEKYMNKTHLVGDASAEDDVGHPRMLEFYVSKGYEVKEPMEPDSEPTGNVLYVVNEKYVGPQGIPEHMKSGEENWEKFPMLMEMIEKYGIFMDTNGVILTNFADDAAPCTARKGDTCINISIAVPTSMEAKVDDIWKEHESFMRNTHNFTSASSGDDMESPRITQFTISKGGYEHANPLDPTSAKTGNVLYTMHETYVHPDGLQGHMALGAKYPDLFDKLMPVGGPYASPLIQENAVYVDFGQTKVFTNLSKPHLASNIVRGFTGVLKSIRGGLEKVTGEKAGSSK